MNLVHDRQTPVSHDGKNVQIRAPYIIDGKPVAGRCLFPDAETLYASAGCPLPETVLFVRRRGSGADPS